MLDNLKWKKNSLKIYWEWKTKVGKDDMHDNTTAAITLVLKCRTKTSKMNDRSRFTRGGSKCPFCETDPEDLEHFFLDCKKYQERGMLQKNYNNPTRQTDNN